MSGGKQRTNPVDAAMARLADLAGRGVQPARLAREVDTIVAGWLDGASAVPPDEVAERLVVLHENLTAGAEAAAEQLADIDRGDNGALRHAGLVHAALLAAVQAIEAAQRPAKAAPDPIVATPPTPPAPVVAAMMTPVGDPSASGDAVTIPPLATWNPQGVDHSYTAELRAEVQEPTPVSVTPAATTTRKPRRRKQAAAADDLYRAAG
jgi:hypothetical protein